MEKIMKKNVYTQITAVKQKLIQHGNQLYFNKNCFWEKKKDMKESAIKRHFAGSQQSKVK